MKDFNNQENVAIVIFWPRAYEAISEVSSYFEDNFSVLEHVESVLEKENVMQLLCDMYDVRRSLLEEKANQIGVGKFRIVKIIDSQPEMGFENTMSGIQFLNKNFFKLKGILRRNPSTAGQIHITNNELEYCKHQKILSNFLSEKTKYSRNYKNNWSSLRQFFDEMNEKCNYSILRGHELLYAREEAFLSQHDDIDILVLDKDEFVKISGLVKKNTPHYDNRYCLYINGQLVYLDIFVPGDKDLPEEWQIRILRSSIKWDNLYIPDRLNGFYCYLFHLLLHKQNVEESQLDRLALYFSELPESHLILSDSLNFNKLLKNFMALYGYKSQRPKNLRNYYNLANACELGVHRFGLIGNVPTLLSHQKKLIKSYYFYLRRLARLAKSYAINKSTN
ncbi:hypothetical protein OAA71_02190 [Porticoccaceae bacterium]|nr:hypothetical protein [Porticoccaceae bacterium]